MGPVAPSRLALTAAVLLGVAACSAPEPPDPFAPRAVHQRGRWAVSQDGRRLGEVVLLEIEDPAEPIRMYRAENSVGQWLGYLDADRRVFQRVPFEDREVFRGIYTMEKGLALLYEVEGAVELTPLEGPDGTATEAAIRFPPREDR